MNILSFCSTIVCVLYCVLFVNRAENGIKDRSVQFSMLVFVCLGWWAFCDAFFYTASNEAAAWLWLQLGALGWSGFIPITSYYFLVMCGDDKKLDTLFKQLCFWVPAILLTGLFIFPGHCALADGLVRSGSGLGWAYKQSFTSPWPYLLLIELIVYLGGALFRLYRWQRKFTGSAVQTLSLGFIVLDAMSVSLGFVIIFVLPQFTTFLPPVNFLATLLFLMGYWNELRNHDLKHIELALDPTNIFENSMDAVLITDTKWRVLYSNQEAKRILGVENTEELFFNDCLTSEGKEILDSIIDRGVQHNSGIELFLAGHIPLLCSINRTSTRKGRHQLLVISMHDASSLRGAQEKLEHLALLDELTGLPNRRRLGELLDQWEDEYAGFGGDFSVLFLDLNRFKSINDYFGHGSGDKALVAVANALISSIPVGDEVARISGDEFIILHAPGGMSDDELAMLIHNSVTDIDCSSFAPGNHLDASIGSCRFSEAGSVHNLIKLADQRMYEIKRRMHESER